jgi:hypothetical protein
LAILERNDRKLLPNITKAKQNKLGYTKTILCRSEMSYYFFLSWHYRSKTNVIIQKNHAREAKLRISVVKRTFFMLKLGNSEAK